MAEQLVDGPPNKRQKLGAPDTPTDNAEFNWKFMEDLDASLPDELVGPGMIPNSDGLTNGETADVASSSSTLQQMLQSNVSLSSGASSTLNSSAISTTVTVSSPNSPSLTTLTSVKSPAVNNSLSSPPQMPVSTSGTPTPATPLTSSSDLHLGSVGLSPAPSSSPLSTINSALQNKARGDARLQVGAPYSNNSLDMNMLGNNNALMGSMNGPSSGSQSIALNTMVRGSGAPLFSRTNMNLTNSGSNPFQNSLPQLQQEQLANNFVNHPGINGSPEQSRASLGQQGTGLAQTPTADPEKQRLIQEHIILLCHAHKCQRQEQQAQNGVVKPCNLPHCRTMKNVLSHMSTCTVGKTCQVALCALSRKHISHWKNCLRQDCPVCLPLRQASDNRRVTGNVQGLERAYEALGLTLTNGEPRLQLFIYLTDSNSFGETSATATSTTANCNPGTKEWHQHVTPDLRSHLVHNFFTALFPTRSHCPAALRDPRYWRLVSLVHNEEGVMYEEANSREEYYHLLAERLYKFQTKIEEVRQRNITQRLRGSILFVGEHVFSRQHEVVNLGAKKTRRRSQRYIYKMTAKPRGLCLIINNVAFKPPLNHRTGTVEDVRELYWLFSGLQFEVETKQNVGGKQLLRILEDIAVRTDHSPYDCFVLCIMSHGTEGDKICCSDGGSVDIEEVLEFFNNVDCKTLAGKPKLFFIQACRGSNIDKVLVVDEPDEPPRKRGKKSTKYDGPKEPSGTAHSNVQWQTRDSRYAHYLVFNSTVPKYKSHKNQGTSLFVSGLVEVFQERSEDEDLMGILARVIGFVNKYSWPLTENGKTFGCKQTCEISKFTLVKKVFL